MSVRVEFLLARYDTTTTKPDFSSKKKTTQVLQANSRNNIFLQFKCEFTISFAVNQSVPLSKMLSNNKRIKDINTCKLFAE